MEAVALWWAARWPAMASALLLMTGRARRLAAVMEVEMTMMMARFWALHPQASWAQSGARRAGAALRRRRWTRPCPRARGLVASRLRRVVEEELACRRWAPGRQPDRAMCAQLATHVRAYFLMKACGASVMAGSSGGCVVANA